jgi:hypothetical protein
VLSWRSAAIALAVLSSVACAGTIVEPSDLPPENHSARKRDGDLVLVLADVPGPMADELRSWAIAGGAVRELDSLAGEDLRAGCSDPSDVVLRPRFGREHFASNAPDRNTLFIYETAVIVGIPVTLVSAVTWPWYAQTVVDGQLEVLACESAEPVKVVDSFFLRSEGKGFVRTHTLEAAQHDAAARGLMRQLLSEAFPTNGRAR